MSIELNTVPDAVEAIRRGEVVIVVDAEDRENEGDYICAAEKASPEMSTSIHHQKINDARFGLSPAEAGFFVPKQSITV